MDKAYRYFLEIVDSGSISAAAKNLHVSQPALSLSLKSLESELHTELVVRSRRGVRLTDDGKKVYDKLLALRVAEKNLFSALQTGSGFEAKLNVGAIDSLALSLVSEIDVAESNLQITVDSSRKLSEMVVTGNIDVAYVVKPRAEIPGLVYKPLGGEEMVAVAAERPESKIVRLLAYNADSDTYRHIMQSLQNAGLKPDPVFHSTDPHLLAEAAVQNKGVAVIPRTLYTRVKTNKLLLVYKNVELLRPIVRVTRQDRWLPANLKNIEVSIKSKLR